MSEFDDALKFKDFQAIYNTRAEEYNERHYWILEQMGAVLVESLMGNLDFETEDTLRVLDMGCGTGLSGLSLVKSLEAVTQRKPGLVGLDINRAMMSNRLDGTHIMVEGDYSNMPFRPGSFDITIASMTVSNGNRFGKVATASRAVTRRGGLVFVIEPVSDHRCNDVMTAFESESGLCLVKSWDETFNSKYTVPGGVEFDLRIGMLKVQ